MNQVSRKASGWVITLETGRSAFLIKDLVRRKGVGTGFVAGGMLAMLMTTASQAVYPQFSTRVDTISFLGGVGVPTAIFLNSAIIIAGLLWILSSYRLFKDSGRKFAPIPFYLGAWDSFSLASPHGTSICSHIPLEPILSSPLEL